MTGLVEKLITGSKPAFEALYQQYHRKVYLFVSKQTSQVAQVEDLVHDIFIKLWENRAGLSLEVPIEAQLFVIARQVTINYYKREVLKQKVYDNLAIEKEKTASEDEESTSNEIFTQLNTAIEALPPKRRQIFKMSKMEGLTYEEIAEALAISKSTVESQMVKALKFLRKQVSQLPFF
jgi:RNA polymerase sigma-70 factor (family 1)